MLERSHPFRGFIGQRTIVNRLQRQLEGSQSLREPFPHTLFMGPSGVGKTELTRALAAEFGSNIIISQCNQAPWEIATDLETLKVGDFLFLDEAHNLKPSLQEILYQVIDDGLIADVSPKGKTHQSQGPDPISISPCTIVLATDQPGRLNNALIKRIPIKVALNFYSEQEMQEIVDLHATGLNLLLSPQASRRVAKVSGGLPRNAKHYLQNLRRHIPGAETSRITTQQVSGFLLDFGIDSMGFSDQERRYLRYLEGAERASLDTLASYLGQDSEYVRRQIEPQLVQRNAFVSITNTGRRLTPAGQQWLERQASKVKE